MNQPEELDIREEKVVTFEFDNQVGGVPIATVNPIEVDVRLGTDATPLAILVGSAAIDNAKFWVLQRVKGTVVDVTYRLSCNVIDAAGLKHTCVKLITVKRF